MKRRYLVQNEKGIALVMVLVLSALSLAIMSVLVFMITSGTKISGMEKRYLTALEAAYGAVEDLSGTPPGGGGTPPGGGGTPPDDNMINDIKDGSFSPADYNSFSWGAFGSACVQQKITKNATAANWAACGVFAAILSPINPTNNTTYDYAFNIPANNPTHRAFVKIIHSGMGNTVKKILRTGSVVTPRLASYLPAVVSSYSFEILTANLANPEDRARLSFLFAQ